ncbi:hypothetical protein BS78_08G143800 [Paspalum vaginatum]|nr:hypothetical protein BS78_08G143800 [Paspalum vaginatum]
MSSSSAHRVARAGGCAAGLLPRGDPGGDLPPPGRRGRRRPRLRRLHHLPPRRLRAPVPPPLPVPPPAAHPLPPRVPCVRCVPACRAAPRFRPCRTRPRGGRRLHLLFHRRPWLLAGPRRPHPHVPARQPRRRRRQRGPHRLRPLASPVRAASAHPRRPPPR